MQVPVWIKPVVWGGVFGAMGIMIVGFSWMGWTLGHTDQETRDGRQRVRPWSLR